jgi:uncharacterized Zn-binding protein involved in type VI secretion
MSAKAVVRKGLDKHIGHASPTPNPFHSTAYSNAAQSKVFADGALVVVDGGATGCGDEVQDKSAKVFAEGKGFHRKGDATTGHGSFVANKAATGSSKVFAG